MGFAEWSKSREPEQCFYLLEQLYVTFDQLAYQHNVVKVEVVGNCYVAVAGLVDNDDDNDDSTSDTKDHDPPVVAAARFSLACVESMAQQLGNPDLLLLLLKDLEDGPSST